MPKAQIVFQLKRAPPINFNLTLHAHAMQHGLAVQHIGMHPHSSGASMSVHVSGDLNRAKGFADHMVNNFNTYLHSAEVRFEDSARRI